MQLQHHIAQLLKNHNCVIVPGFGGFIGNYEPANADYVTHLFFPPAKRVLFNANLIQGDGLLANELMRSEGLSYNEAIEQIAAFVEACKKSLAAGERIEFEEAGFLFAQNGKFIFEQNRETNLLLSSYGLKQIPFVDFRIKPVTSAKVQEKVVSEPILKRPDSYQDQDNLKVTVEKVAKESLVKKDETPVIALDTESTIEAVEQEEDEKVISIHHNKNKEKAANINRNRRYKYLAAAVVLPALFYSYWIPMKTDALSTGKIQWGDFNPLQPQSPQLYNPRTSAFAYEGSDDWKTWDELTGSLPGDVMIYNYELDEETYIPVLLERDGSAPVSTEGMFHLIANCFSVKKNAENYVDELNSKGYKASIVGKHNGLHRVSAGAFATENEAESALEAFKSSGNSGWILEP